jgi:hypothetical protein
MLEDYHEDSHRAPIDMVVVANPRNRTLKVYRMRAEILVLSIADTFSAADFLPGFQFPVCQIFKP